MPRRRILGMCAAIALLALGAALVATVPNGQRAVHEESTQAETFTLLHRAAERGFLNSVKAQLEKGEDVNAADPRGMAPLHYAAGEGHHEIVAMLLEAGALVSARGERGWTPVHMAAAMGRAELSELLLDRGADPNAPDEAGLTPLHHAAVEGCEDVTRVLLSHGARANVKDRRGWTPLHHAAYAGHPEVSDLLLAGGADADAEDAEGRTPFEQARLGDQASLVASPLPAAASRGRSRERPDPSRDTPPNVLLIVVDALRPDRLRCHGYERATSPRLDALAAEGVLFTDVMAQGAATMTATPPLLTGRRQGEHGMVWVRWGQAVHHAEPGPDARTLAELLRQGGYATAGISATPLLGAETGLHRGFDYFDLSPAQGPVWVKNSAPEINLSACRWLERHAPAQKPFFLYLHYIGPHLYYCPPSEFCVFGRPAYTHRDTDRNRRVFDREWLPDREVTDEVLAAQGLSRADLERLSDLYDDEVLCADYYLGQLFDRLKELGLYDTTIIIVTADHGEAFLEHNILEHHGALYQELIRIPLIIRGPGIPGGRAIHELVESVDIAPTVLEAAAIPLRTQMSGRSFFQTLIKGTRITKDVGLAEIPSSSTYALRRGRLKLISSPRGVELYDLSRDPGETQDLAPSRAEEVNRLQVVLSELLQQRAEAAQTTQVPTESQLRAMRSLGYLK